MLRLTELITLTSVVGPERTMDKLNGRLIRGICFWTLFIVWSTSCVVAVESQAAEFVLENVELGEGEWLKIGFVSYRNEADFADVVSQVRNVLDRGCEVVVILAEVVPDQAVDLPRTIASLREQYSSVIFLPGLHWRYQLEGSSDSMTMLVPDVSEVPSLNELISKLNNGDQFTDAEVTEILKHVRTRKWSEARFPLIFFEPEPWSGENAEDLVDSLLAWRKKCEFIAGFPLIVTSSMATPQPDPEQFDQALEVRKLASERLLGVFQSRSTHSIAIPHGLLKGSINPERDLSETWVRVAERSKSGVLRALQRDATSVAAGGVASQLRFSVDTIGLSRPALSGDRIRVEEGKFLEVTFSCDVPALDGFGSVNWVDELELAVISNGNVEELVHSAIQMGTARHRWLVRMPAEGVVLRASARRMVESGPDLIALSGTIHVEAVPITPGKIQEVVASLFSNSIILPLGVGIAFCFVVAFIFLQLLRARKRKFAAAVVPLAFRQKEQLSEEGRRGIRTSTEVDWQPPKVLRTKVDLVHDEAKQAPNVSPPGRIHFAFSALVSTLIVASGLCLPLRVSLLSLKEAITSFRQIPFHQLTSYPLLEWCANVLLFVPLGFLWAGMVVLDQQRPSMKCLAIILVTVSLAGFAMIMEFAQLYFPPNELSQNDIYAASLGGFLGATLSVFLIRRIIGKLRVGI